MRLVPAVLTKRAVREAGNADGGTATISLIRTLVLCDGDAAKYRIEGLSIPSFAQAILHFAAVRPFRAPAIVRASAPTAVDLAPNLLALFYDIGDLVALGIHDDDLAIAYKKLVGP